MKTKRDASSMSHTVIRKVLDNVKGSPFLSVIVYETTDTSNLEQVTLVIRRISDDLSVSEDFLDMFSLSSFNATSIVSILLDALMRFQIPLSKVHWQIYDGCNTIARANELSFNAFAQFHYYTECVVPVV